MASHRIKTGLWAKKKWDKRQLYNLAHSMTPAQMSFCREAVLQALGESPTEYWGKSKLWFRPKASRKTLMYFLEATNHAPHIFARKLSKHKEAGSVLSGIAHAVVTGGKAVGKVVLRGAKWALGHAGQILHAVDTGLNIGSAAVAIAAQTGLLDPETDSTLIDMANIYGTMSSAYHENDEPEKAKESAEKPASGRLKDLGVSMGKGLSKMNLDPGPKKKWIHNAAGNYVYGYGESGTETREEAIARQKAASGPWLRNAKRNFDKFSADQKLLAQVKEERRKNTPFYKMIEEAQKKQASGPLDVNALDIFTKGPAAWAREVDQQRRREIVLHRKRIGQLM